MKYEVTSPDGRKLILEGDSAPTEQELENIFANYKPQDNYSALDKAKYIGRAGAEGLTFGLGDVVAGVTNVPMNYLAGNFENPIKLFKEGRKDFVNEQEAFAKEHPALNFAGEIGGGLVTGALGAGKNIVKTGVKQGLKQLTKTGANTGLKEGAKFGMAYGAGSGLTQDADELSISNALLGAGMGLPTGAVIGAGLGAAIPVGVHYATKGLNKAAKGVGKVINFFKNKDINAVEKVAGADNITKSIREGTPLIDNANEGTLDLALGTKQDDPKAGQIYVNYARERLQGQRPKINQMIESISGDKGASQLLEEINADTLAGSKVLYDKAKYVTDKAGNVVLDNAGKPVGKVLPEFETVPKEMSFIAKYIGKVRKNDNLGYELQGLPNNDMRVLDYAKQFMDDEISMLQKQSRNSEARNLIIKRDAFVQKLDNANPEYKTARNFFERGKKAEEALQLGRNFDKGSIKNKLFEFNKLTDEQKKFYRLGMGDRITEHTNVKTEGGNIAQRVFDAETNKRLKIFGVKDADKLIEQAKKESITAANLQRLLQGSQTAEKQASVGRWATNPNRQAKGIVARAIDSVYGKIVNPNAEQVAKMLTDPKYLQQKQLQAMQKDINFARRIGKANFDFLRSGGIIGGDIVANSNSWQHIKKSPDWRTFEGLPKIKEIIGRGKSIKNVPNYKERADDFNSWNYYLKDIKTPEGNKVQVVTVGNRPNGQKLYGFNPDFEDWAIKNPEKAKKIADTVGKPLTVRPNSTSNYVDTDSTYINSITDILQNVNNLEGLSKKDKKAIQEILKQAGYKSAVIEQSNKEAK